jgi:hypothetical protein
MPGPSFTLLTALSESPFVSRAIWPPRVSTVWVFPLTPGRTIAGGWFAPRLQKTTFLLRKNTEFVRNLKPPFGQPVVECKVLFRKLAPASVDPFLCDGVSPPA